jgi:hypothetical protein
LRPLRFRGGRRGRTESGLDTRAPAAAGGEEKDEHCPITGRTQRLTAAGMALQGLRLSVRAGRAAGNLPHL